jgi:hypothetical protein
VNGSLSGDRCLDDSEALKCLGIEFGVVGVFVFDRREDAPICCLALVRVGVVFWRIGICEMPKVGRISEPLWPWAMISAEPCSAHVVCVNTGLRASAVCASVCSVELSATPLVEMASEARSL